MRWSEFLPGGRAAKVTPRSDAALVARQGMFHVEPPCPCGPPGKLGFRDTWHPLCPIHPKPGVSIGQLSRRRFLFLGAAAGVALAVGPSLELFAPPVQTIDGVFKEVYGPIIARMMNCRILVTHEMLADSVLLGPGHFMDVAAREVAATAEDFRKFGVIRGIGG